MLTAIVLAIAPEVLNGPYGATKAYVPERLACRCARNWPLSPHRGSCLTEATR
jgi:hypothetical protein